MNNVSDAMVDLGRGDDTAILFSASSSDRRTELRGGSGDDEFKIRTHHGDVPELDHPGPLSGARLLGESGDDTLSWDCRATIDVARDQLKCTDKYADAKFGGMQRYEGDKYKDIFRGSARRDVFIGKGNDDTMYGRKGADRLIGGKGYDIADGGPGDDSCRANREISC